MLWKPIANDRNLVVVMLLQVLDDVNDLNDSFSLELTECFDALHLQRSKLQVVAAGSRWTTEFDCTVSKIAECEVKIVSCPMDIAVKNSVHLVSFFVVFIVSLFILLLPFSGST